MFDKITQLIPTIQGEGPKLGVPSLLIRFKQCNLVCPFCDTQWSNKHTGDEFDHTSIEEIFEKYPKISNIMITGGEPFLYINEIIALLKSMADVFPQIKTVEIETNGTKINSDIIKKLYLSVPIGRYSITFNISPKLGPECYVKSETMNSIISRYKNNIKELNTVVDNTYIDYIFKIVYSEDWIPHIESFIDLVINDVGKQTNIYLMPKSPDFRDYTFTEERDDLLCELDFFKDFRQSCINTVEKCMEWGFIFSPREHVWIYMDNKNEQIEVNCD